MSLLESLPSSILLESLFPLLSVRETLFLSGVNKFFSKLGQQDGVWERRLRVDYGFTNTSIAGNRGLKFLYSRIFNPKFYVWGGTPTSVDYPPLPENGMGSLQYWLPTSPNATREMVALPPGGWSFSAVGPSNDIYLLENRLVGDSMVHPGTWISCPQPRKFIDHSHHRFNGQWGAQVLGGAGQGWRLTSWGNPFINSPKDFSHSDKFIQVQNAQSVDRPVISAAVTALGDVLLWGFHYKWSQQTKDSIQISDKISKRLPGRVANVGYITLPGLPKLPHLKGTKRDTLRIIQVAIGYYYLFGLTDGGHVLRFSLRNFKRDMEWPEMRDVLDQSGWEYLPQFCERERVERLSTFRGKRVDALPMEFQITHIAAHNWDFVAYSTGLDSVILMDTRSSVDVMVPKIVTSLLRQQIVSVVLGNDHVGVLTEDGRVFTWAQKMRFQSFRLWHIQQPREMKFDYSSFRTRNYFVLAIASTPWEMGALVIDLGDKDFSIRRWVMWRPDWQKFKFIIFHYVAGDHPGFGYRAWLRLLAYTVVVPATFMLQCIFPRGRAMYTEWRRKACRI